MSNHERFSEVAHQKRVTMSGSLRSLIFCKNESDSLRKPMSKFPTLNIRDLLPKLIFLFWECNIKNLVLLVLAAILLLLNHCIHYFSSPFTLSIVKFELKNNLCVPPEQRLNIFDFVQIR